MFIIVHVLFFRVLLNSLWFIMIQYRIATLADLFLADERHFFNIVDSGRSRRVVSLRFLFGE